MTYLLVIMVLLGPTKGIIGPRPMPFPSLQACEKVLSVLTPPMRVREQAEGWVAECLPIETMGVET